MIYLDISAFIIIVTFSVFGYLRGFIKEVIQTLGVVFSATIAYLFYPDMLKLFFPDQEISWGYSITIFIAIFIVLMILLTLLGILLKKFIKHFNLGKLDNVLGFVMGSVKGGIIIAALGMSIIWLVPNGDRLIHNTKVVKADLIIYDLMSKMLPDSYKSKYMSAIGNYVNIDSTNMQTIEALTSSYQILDSIYTSAALEASSKLMNTESHNIDSFISGTVIHWNNIQNEGMISSKYNDTTIHIPFYFGSFKDTSQLINLQTNQDIQFQIAYSQLLHRYYANSITVNR